MRTIIVIAVFITVQTTWAKLSLKPGAYRMNSIMTVDGKEVDAQKEMQEAMKEMQKSLKGMDLSMLPESARKQIEKVSEDQDAGKKLFETCMKQEDVNMDRKTIAKMMAHSANDNMKDCKSKVIKATAKEIETKTVCKDESMTFNMKVLSPTKFEQVMTEYKKNGKKGDVVKIRGERFSDTCPDYILKRDQELKKIAQKWEDIQAEGGALQKPKTSAPNQKKQAPAKKTKAQK